MVEHHRDWPITSLVLTCLAVVFFVVVGEVFRRRLSDSNAPRKASLVTLAAMCFSVTFFALAIITDAFHGIAASKTSTMLDRFYREGVAIQELSYGCELDREVDKGVATRRFG